LEKERTNREHPKKGGKKRQFELKVSISQYLKGELKSNYKRNPQGLDEKKLSNKHPTSKRGKDLQQRKKSLKGKTKKTKKERN